MKITKINFLMLAVFLMLPVVLFAQEFAAVDIEETFASLAGLVAAAVLITGLYKKYISDKNTFIVSIVVSTLLCAAGYFLQWGIFIGALWWHALIYDVGIIFIAKGTVSIELVITILNLLKIGPKKPE